MTSQQSKTPKKSGSRPKQDEIVAKMREAAKDPENLELEGELVAICRRAGSHYASLAAEKYIKARSAEVSEKIQATYESYAASGRTAADKRDIRKSVKKAVKDLGEESADLMRTLAVACKRTGGSRQRATIVSDKLVSFLLGVDFGLAYQEVDGEKSSEFNPTGKKLQDHLNLLLKDKICTSGALMVLLTLYIQKVGHLSDPGAGQIIHTDDRMLKHFGDELKAVIVDKSELNARLIAAKEAELGRKLDFSDKDTADSKEFRPLYIGSQICLPSGKKPGNFRYADLSSLIALLTTQRKNLSEKDQEKIDSEECVADMDTMRYLITSTHHLHKAQTNALKKASKK